MCTHDGLGGKKRTKDHEECGRFQMVETQLNKLTPKEWDFVSDQGGRRDGSP